MPKSSTDKLLLRGPQHARVLRRFPSGSPQAVAELTFEPSLEVSYTDKLPHDLTSGPLRLLTYRVELQNHAGQSAGSSNDAYTAAGEGPAPLSGLTATMRPEGVLLHWAVVVEDQAGVAGGQTGPAAGHLPPGAEASIRILRTLEVGAQVPNARATKKGSAFSQPQAEAREQSLMVRQSPRHDAGDSDSGSATGRAAGSAFDASAILDRKYTYVAQRLYLATFGTHSVEVAGLASPPVEVDTKDAFPPKAPEDLAAVAVPEEKAIDLSWTPNTEADLAGYAVYRREGHGDWTRISPSAELVAPEFRDTAVDHARGYSYVVTAIDRSGNESARSAIAEETLP